MEGREGEAGQDQLVPPQPVKREPKTRYHYDLVEVRWDDAHGEAGWTDISKKPLEAAIALTVGFLIRDEPEYILVADSYFENEVTYIGGTNQIPRGMVKSMRVIRKASKK